MRRMDGSSHSEEREIVVRYSHHSQLHHPALQTHSHHYASLSSGFFSLPPSSSSHSGMQASGKFAGRAKQHRHRSRDPAIQTRLISYHRQASNLDGQSEQRFVILFSREGHQHGLCQTSTATSLSLYGFSPLNVRSR